jgi:hypothetical protein
MTLRLFTEMSDEELTREALDLLAMFTEHDADEDTAEIAAAVRYQVLRLYGANAGLAKSPGNVFLADQHACARAYLEDHLGLIRAAVR